MNQETGIKRNQLGFTFIEIIIYLAIIMLMMTTLIPFAWNIIGGGTKNSTQQEIFSQARSISNRISYEIRNASGVNSVTSTQISLVTPFSATNPTIINLAGGFIRIKQGSANYEYLNSKYASVSALTFTNYTSGDTKTKHIQFVFNLSASYSGTVRHEYQESTTIESSAEVRSN